MIVQKNYIAGTTRPNNIFAVHKCPKYSIYTKQYHGEAIKRIERYLKERKDEGLVFKPDGSNGIECYAGAYLYGS